MIAGVLARSNTVKALTTSREGLRLPGEHLWPVPSLDMRAGVESTAIALFVERACEVVPGFALNGNTAAVTEICTRLDGIPLAIELAAARMVSMSAADVRDRLGDRFRLLSGGRRGLERHQTLRHAVQWSYDLLTDDERGLLNRCSVFAGGFDLKIAVQVCGGDALDEYTVLELLDSLVRKSLVAVDSSSGTARYTLLETIRQFAEDQLVASDNGDEIRDRHARVFADLAHAMVDTWASPAQRVAHGWVDVELANLRAAFRWAVEREQLETAATIASGAVILGSWAQRLEPVTWAEELLRNPRSHDLRNVRGLYAAAAACFWLARPEDGIRYGEAGLALLGRPGYEPVPLGLDYLFLSGSYMFAGRMDEVIELCRTSAELGRDPTVMDRAVIVWCLGSLGRFDEARAIVDDTLAAAEAAGVPHVIAYALDASSIAFAESDPVRALAASRRSMTIARGNLARMQEAITARSLAGLEATHGDRRIGLKTFDETIDSFGQSGDFDNLAVAFGYLAVFFDRTDRAVTAATLCGACQSNAFAMNAVPRLQVVAEHLREVLGTTTFEDLSREGAAMDRSHAVQYAHAEIQRAREESDSAP